MSTIDSTGGGYQVQLDAQKEEQVTGTAQVHMAHDHDNPLGPLPTMLQNSTTDHMNNYKARSIASLKRRCTQREVSCALRSSSRGGGCHDNTDVQQAMEGDEGLG